MSFRVGVFMLKTNSHTELESGFATYIAAEARLVQLDTSYNTSCGHGKPQFIFAISDGPMYISTFQNPFWQTMAGLWSKHATQTTANQAAAKNQSSGIANWLGKSLAPFMSDDFKFVIPMHATPETDKQKETYKATFSPFYLAGTQTASTPAGGAITGGTTAKEKQSLLPTGSGTPLKAWPGK